MECRSPEQVPGALRRLESAVEGKGLHAAGFLAYEAAAAFGLPVRSPGASDVPLLWFGLFRPPSEVAGPGVGPARYEVGPWEATLDSAGHARAAERIRELIAAGDTYQVNLTFPLEAAFAGDAWSFFADLAAAQRAAHAAYLDLGRHAVCSVSPELFFRREGERLITRPMKGTAPRGRTSAEDARQRAWLRQSGKNRAENLMIVDMLRNDLGRVAEVGSVEVADLFRVEPYPTLLQMTSTVTARSNEPLEAILPALFPCASVTGAPKIRTMEIIRDLEAGPRGLYTGAIGHVAPGRRASFAVAIRTAVVDRQRDRAEYGVGSGIVWDSRAEDEYAECRLKARVLTEPPFRLLESLRFTPGEGFFLLDAHLDRLYESAAHFGVPLDRARVRRELLRQGAAVPVPSKVRLLVGADGDPQVEAEPLGVQVEPVCVGLAAAPVDPRSPWLYHKTTRREVYDAARASRPDCDDVILWNDRGEVTEASRSNVVIEDADGLLTPPVDCGLLPGTFRAHLLAAGQIRERVVSVEDFRRARRVFLISSVRLWRPALFKVS